MVIAAQPTTQGFPSPLATTAAWEVFPPLLVRTPSAAKKPWTSSGLVSSLTRMTFSPFFVHSTAVSASKTALPEHAPGAAGTPVAIGFSLLLGSTLG